MPQRHVINASVSPKGSLETLSQREVQQLSEAGTGSIYTLFRQCALAILTTGAHIDNAKTILDAYKDFEVRIHQQDRGVRLELLNAPADAFVDGEMIASTREGLRWLENDGRRIRSHETDIYLRRRAERKHRPAPSCRRTH